MCVRYTVLSVVSSLKVTWLNEHQFNQYLSMRSSQYFHWILLSFCQYLPAFPSHSFFTPTFYHRFCFTCKSFAHYLFHASYNRHFPQLYHWFNADSKSVSVDRRFQASSLKCGQGLMPLMDLVLLFLFSITHMCEKRFMLPWAGCISTLNDWLMSSSGHTQREWLRYDIKLLFGCI